MADITVNPVNVKPTNARTRIADGIAGGSISAGQALYIDSNGKLQPALSSSDTQANVVGIALNSAQLDQPIDYAVQGDVTFNAVLTPGTAYVLGGNAGGISPTADLTGNRYGTLIGIATSTSNLSVGVVHSGANPAGSSSWTPAQLTSLWAWYKADTGVFTDVAGTTVAVNNDAVACWKDQSTAGHHITQSDSTKRPVYNTGVLNSLPAIQFTNDFLRWSGTSLSDDMSFFILLRVNQYSAQQVMQLGRWEHFQTTDWNEFNQNGGSFGVS